MSLEVLAAVVACLVSTIVVLVNGGRQVGRVEAAIARLAGIESKLEKVPILEVQLGNVQEAYRAFRSDHKQLASTVDRIRDRLPSTHGDDE